MTALINTSEIALTVSAVVPALDLTSIYVLVIGSSITITDVITTSICALAISSTADVSSGDHYARKGSMFLLGHRNFLE
jgi:hypothetical protein